MITAIYTRFSSTMQREASTEDQARNCRRRIEAEGWQLAKHFKDEAISGSVADRPGYQAMLKSAAAREFGSGRIIGVSDGYDSQSKSRKVQRGVRGLMNEIYLDDLKDKVHRGLAGQALK